MKFKVIESIDEPGIFIAATNTYRFESYQVHSKDEAARLTILLEMVYEVGQNDLRAQLRSLLEVPSSASMLSLEIKFNND